MGSNGPVLFLTGVLLEDEAPLKHIHISMAGLGTDLTLLRLHGNSFPFFVCLQGIALDDSAD